MTCSLHGDSPDELNKILTNLGKSDKSFYGDIINHIDRFVAYNIVDGPEYIAISRLNDKGKKFEHERVPGRHTAIKMLHSLPEDINKRVNVLTFGEAPGDFISLALNNYPNLRASYVEYTPTTAEDEQLFPVQTSTWKARHEKYKTRLIEINKSQCKGDATNKGCVLDSIFKHCENTLEGEQVVITCDAGRAIKDKDYAKFPKFLLIGQSFLLNVLSLFTDDNFSNKMSTKILEKNPEFYIKIQCSYDDDNILLHTLVKYYKILSDFDYAFRIRKPAGSYLNNQEVYVHILRNDNGRIHDEQWAKDFKAILVQCTMYSKAIRSEI